MDLANLVKEAVNSLAQLLIPLLLGASSYFIIIAKSYFKRITVSIEAKNELESLKQTNEIKRQLLEEIESMTKSAVASNMQRADMLKKNNPDGKLTSDQSTQLNDDARELVISSLPDSLTKEGGTLLKIVGGEERLHTIIDSFIEKLVYEYKMEKEKDKHK